MFRKKILDTASNLKVSLPNKLKSQRITPKIASKLVGTLEIAMTSMTSSKKWPLMQAKITNSDKPI